MATAADEIRAAPELVIRAMTEADVPRVGIVERAAYQFPWSENVFRDCVRVGYECRIAEFGGELVSYGIMSMGAGEVHILNLCVRSEFRCRGVGRAMLEHLLARGVAAGMSEAFLEVRPSNIVAIRLYHSMGFEQIGVRRGYYQAVGGREDATVLRLGLDRPASQ